jgi:hypothetical protein
MESEKSTEEESVVQERLKWQVAWRDEMHHLSDAGLLDEFFAFLKDLGMLEAFEH